MLSTTPRSVVMAMLVRPPMLAATHMDRQGLQGVAIACVTHAAERPTRHHTRRAPSQVTSSVVALDRIVARFPEAFLDLRAA